jgi:exocyst complex component 2
LFWLIQGKYDVALRDYKKGKFLLESRPGQLLPLPSSNASNIKEAEAKQKKILDKVWASVEKAMGELRNSSLALLKDHRRSVEEHEKTIECVEDSFIYIYPVLSDLVFQNTLGA